MASNGSDKDLWCCIEQFRGPPFELKGAVADVDAFAYPFTTLCDVNGYSDEPHRPDGLRLHRAGVQRLRDRVFQLRVRVQPRE